MADKKDLEEKAWADIDVGNIVILNCSSNNPNCTVRRKAARYKITKEDIKKYVILK